MIRHGLFVVCPCCTPRFVVLSSGIVKVARSLPHTMVTSHASHISKELASRMATTCGVSIARYEGHGSQGRVFTLHESDQVLKVSKTPTPVNREQHNYSTLNAIGVPCAYASLSITEELEDGTFGHAMLLERLCFTLTAVLRACAITTTRCIIPHLGRACNRILRILQKYRVTYVDLSPDNIMFRRVRHDVYEMVVVDPSYMTIDSPCTSDVFDRLYLAYKVFVLALLHPHCRGMCRHLGTRLLGYEPSTSEVVTWLRTVPPKAVRCVTITLER